MVARTGTTGAGVYPSTGKTRLQLFGRALGLECKLVAGTADGFYQIFRVVSERHPQPSDLHVDGALFNEYVVAPDVIQQLFAAVHAAGMGHEEFEQVEFSRSEIDLVAVDRGGPRRGVQHQRPDFQYL